ncbi:MAG: proteasome accessory factor PafA2 family protein [Proteobacteria bacterium]|nr:proteasome accessory factor PafA2 family protein [Pseudomonadota bacterium]
MRERVFGIETEYAVIYHPGRGERRRPRNLEIYRLFERALKRRVRTLPRAFSWLTTKLGVFLANGASFHYEATPEHFSDGLLELASPECRDPFTLLAHERAKDDLVTDLCEDVNGMLARMGYSGVVRIGKNNLDTRGNTFGSHENYWVEDPVPRREWSRVVPLWALAWAVTVPSLLFQILVVLGYALAPVVALPLYGVCVWARRRLRRRPAPRLRGALELLARFATRYERWTAELSEDEGQAMSRLAWLEGPQRSVLNLHAKLYGDRVGGELRQQLAAFFATRALFAGSGTVSLDAAPWFRIAQRPPFIRVLTAVFTSGDHRPLFETRDLITRPLSPFRRRRRLHVLVGDANLCDWAQVLRVGTTSLVLEALEAGARDFPVLADPLATLHAVPADLDLARRFTLADGSKATALEIQRRYWREVNRVVGEGAEVPDPWKRRVLGMWRETLDALERRPSDLADRVDWIAKRVWIESRVREEPDAEALVREVGGLRDADPARLDEEQTRRRERLFALLRDDLRYHELGPRGGHRRLERSGRVRRLVEPEAVEKARREPPSDTRALARGRAIDEAGRAQVRGAADWDRVRIGPWRRALPDPLDPAGHLPRAGPPHS